MGAGLLDMLDRKETSRAAATSLFVTLFLVILQPFSVRLDSWFHVAVYIGFGLLLFTVQLASHVFLQRTEQVGYASVRRLSVFLFQLSAIFGYFLFFTEARSGQAVGSLLLKILAAGALPFGVFWLVRQRQSLKRQLYDLHERSGSDDYGVTLQSENGKEILSLQTSQILFARAEDNYVTVTYTVSGEVKEVLLRATLKSIADRLAGKGIIQCHRSYLVNIMQVIRLAGGQQHARLELAGAKETVPVSRSYLAKIRETLVSSD